MLINQKNPSELRDVVLTLADIVGICKEYQIDYRVFGSTAFVAAIGETYRIPKDIDVIYDINKKDLLFSALIEKGYSQGNLKHEMDSTLPEPLSQFKKGNQIIEPRGVNFTNRGFEFSMLFPLPLIPKKLYPKVALAFLGKMSDGENYQIDGVKFIGLRREALYVGLNTFQSLFSALGDKVSQRKHDLERLENIVDWKVVSEIEEANPGVYYKKLPLITTRFPFFLNIVNWLAKLKVKQ